MKVLLTALLFVGANALADGHLVREWPTLAGIPVNQFCQNDNTIQTLGPVKTCKTYAKVPAWTCDVHGESCMPVNADYKPISMYETIQYTTACTEYETEVLSFKKSYQAKVCEPCYPKGESSECVLEKPVCSVQTVNVKTTYSVDLVVAGSEYTEGGRQWAGSENFTIPACK